MIAAFKILLGLMMVFTAIGLACAVLVGSRRPARPDPFAEPFGEMPGFTSEQLARLAPRVKTSDPLRRSFATRPIRDLRSGGVALRTGAGSGFPFLSGFAAARKFLATRLRRRAATPSRRPCAVEILRRLQRGSRHA
jgi:hypothetical protein